MAEKQERWIRSLPADPADLWEWCLDQSRDTLLDLLAFLAARTVDVIQRKSDDPQGMRLQHGDLLATSLGMDMADWFIPKAAGYFSRISRDGIIQALTEAKECHPAPAWFKMKKAELAALAEKQVAGTGWLPAPVRINNPASDDAEILPEAAEYTIQLDLVPVNGGRIVLRPLREEVGEAQGADGAAAATEAEVEESEDSEAGA